MKAHMVNDRQAREANKYTPLSHSQKSENQTEDWISKLD